MKFKVFLFAILMANVAMCCQKNEQLYEEMRTMERMKSLLEQLEKRCVSSEVDGRMRWPRECSSSHREQIKYLQEELIKPETFTKEIALLRGLIEKLKLESKDGSSEQILDLAARIKELEDTLFALLVEGVVNNKTKVN